MKFVERKSKELFSTRFKNTMLESKDVLTNEFY